MRIQFLASAVTLGAIAALSAASSTSSPSAAASTSGETRNSALAAEDVVRPEDAARFAKQASFGPTLELINAIVAKKSIAAWIEDQFMLASSTYADLAGKAVPDNYCTSFTGTDLSTCNRDNFSATPVQTRFYANAINKDDQLRQRIAFALSQIVVASEVEVHQTAGLAGFNQILLNNAFGNYRDILKAVTVNPYMGEYLDLGDSDKGQPNENYAREMIAGNCTFESGRYAANRQQRRNDCCL